MVDLPDWELGEAPAAAKPFESPSAVKEPPPDWEVDDFEQPEVPIPDETGGWEVATPVAWATAPEATGRPPEVVGDLEAAAETVFPGADQRDLSGEPELLEAGLETASEPVEVESAQGRYEVDPGHELESESEPLSESDEEEWSEFEEIPLPTLTLARLAHEQGDLRLAERTLLGVLERQPNSAEARALLEQIRSERSPVPPTAPAMDEAAAAAEAQEAAKPAIAKIAALHAWADAIRLAAEQRRP